MVLQPLLGPGLTQRCLHTCLSPAHLLQPCIPRACLDNILPSCSWFPYRSCVVEFLIKIFFLWGCIVHSHDVTHPPQSFDCNIKSSTFLFMLLCATNATPNSLVHFYLLYKSVCDIVFIASFLFQSCFLQCCYAESIVFQLEEHGNKCCGFKQCLDIPRATFKLLFHIATQSSTYQFHLRHL